MTIQSLPSRRFVPGTTGWTEDDLYDPQIEKLWERGRYEIVEGVLTKMPAANLMGSFPLRRLVNQIERHLELTGAAGEFGFEVDTVINKVRLPRIDAVFLTPDQLQQQLAAEAKLRKRRNVRFGRLRIAPELVIESISEGHEIHDRHTKREWYRGFHIPNYWIFDAYQKSLECLRLDGTEYHIDVIGSGDEVITPAMFAGLSIQLAKVWM